MNPSQKFGIYIHWPFCLSKCPYCDFFSQVRKDISQESIIEEYLSELDFYYNLTNNQTVTSIFFGGGTPSLITPQNIEKIINHINNKWKITENIEISLEANPNTNYKNLFHDLKSSGINRLSLGIQSLNDKDLKFLGRTHNSKEALIAINDVLNTFDNHSMDMIYALPHQKTSTWEKDLEKIISFGFKHLSLYQLTIEEGTIFAKNGINPLDEEQASKMYQFTSSFLDNYGYNRYEVSNFAQKGYEANHNLTYWEGYDYIGIGKSAHGRIGLLATTYPKHIEKLSKKERAEELVIMGLRLKEGINKQRFETISGLNFNNFVNFQNLKKMIELGLVVDNETTFKTTPKGSLLINHIINEIIC